MTFLQYDHNNYINLAKLETIWWVKNSLNGKWRLEFSSGPDCNYAVNEAFTSSFCHAVNISPR